jgi:flagellar protein FliS
MSIARAASRYKAVQVQTSSPGAILLMLFDGVFKFLDEAKAAVVADDRARAGERIERAHAILTELAATLDRRGAPELCENLESIYVFCMSRLVEANLYRDANRIEDVRRVLSPVREAFRQAVQSSTTQS